MGNALQLLSPTTLFSTEVLSTAFEKSSEGLAIVDQDRIVHANAGFAEVFGYSDFNEIKGKSFTELRATGEYCSRASAVEETGDDQSRPL